MPNESGSAILTVFRNLIDQIKSTRPVRTDGKALTTGFVYSQTVLGRMVDPRDYTNPWSPMGGSTLQDTVKSMPAPTGSPVSGGSSAPTPDPKFRRALDAAFKTAELVDNMIMVTKDGSFLEYPTQRRISSNYESSSSSMQPTPMPPIAPEVQKQIDDSKKVLYEFDDEDNIVGKSKLYKLYVKNSQAFAKAKKDYAEAQASALADPVKADDGCGTRPKKTVKTMIEQGNDYVMTVKGNQKSLHQRLGAISTDCTPVSANGTMSRDTNV